MKRIMREKTSVCSIIILVLLGCLLFAMPASAADAGDGSGGGQGVPVGLASSVPSDGQKDFPLDGVIKLTFNKNVINLTVREINKKCFSLLTGDGNKVPIEVIMADDQLYPEEKRDITINPSYILQPGTAYALKIAPQFQGKNGSTLGHEVTLNFTTAGVAPQPVTPEPAPVSDIEKNQATDTKQPTPTPTENTIKPNSESIQPVIEKAPQAEEKVASLEENKSQPEEKISTNQLVESEKKSNLPNALAAGGVIIVGLGYTSYRLRKR